MSGGGQELCVRALIQAVVIVLIAGVSVPRAAETTGPSLPGQEQAAPAETTAIDVAPADEWADDVVPGLAEEVLSASVADAHVAPYQHQRHDAVPPSDYCRSSRIYRSEILGRLWVRGEYLTWAPKGVNLPSLVTGSTLAAPADTTVLFGDRGVFQEMSSGGRLTGGFWWTHEQFGGIEANYFELDGNDQGLYAQGGGDTILSRPFFDVPNGVPSVALVAYPGVLDGAINVRADMELSGAEFLWRRMIGCSPTFRLDLVSGYRYGRLFDRVATEESMVSLDPSSGWNTDTIISVLDSFETANDFHGGELGLLARWRRSCWSLDVTGKVALGGTTTTTTISGSTETLETINDVDVLTSYSGGVLALPTNIGTYRQGKVAVISELEVVLRRELACDLWFRLGYNLLTWSRVGRAADQIDVGVNPSQIPPAPPPLVGEARPAFTPATTSFWAQGLNVGLEYQF